MIALVDCNNFFASCERLFRPDLINKPVAVLSNNDGCVVARSNEVKALGVPMGVPYFQVRDTLTRHNVTLFSSNFALYSNISQRIQNELARFSPELEVYSIDEAFLQLEGLGIKNYKRWGNDLKDSIGRNIGMPVSVGIAPTKTLAKLASNWSKRHDGVCLLHPDQAPQTYKTVLQNTSIQAVWGIGRRISKKLIAAGIRTPWHLTQASPVWLRSTFGINGERVHAELIGKVQYVFENKRSPQKSVVTSRSFGRSVIDSYELDNALASFTAQAAARLRKFQQLTELFGIYLRGVDDDGQLYNKAVSAHMLPPTNDTSELTEAALSLLPRIYQQGIRYKKAGVFAYHLSSSVSAQTSLIDAKTASQRSRREQLMETVDSINQRFGGSTVQLATINTRLQKWQGKRQLQSPAYTTSWLELPRAC